MKSTPCITWLLIAASAVSLSAQQGAASRQEAGVAISSEPQLVKRPADFKQLKDAHEKRPQVTLDVFVTDKAGIPVQGLVASDFRVLDDQVEAAGVRF